MSREGIIKAKDWQKGAPKGIYCVYDFLHLVFLCLPLFVIVYLSVEIFFFLHSIYNSLKKIIVKGEYVLTLRAEKLKMLCHRFF